MNWNSIKKPTVDARKIYGHVTFLPPCVVYLFGFFKPRNFSSDDSSRSAMFLTVGDAVQQACDVIGWKVSNGLTDRSSNQ